MGLAYSAALQFASAALAASGYRPARGDHHFRTIDSLTLTIGWDAKRVKRLDAFRKKRNVSAYERSGEVSNAEAQEIQELAVTLRANVVSWLEKHHPGLL